MSAKYISILLSNGIHPHLFFLDSCDLPMVHGLPMAVAVIGSFEGRETMEMRLVYGLATKGSTRHPVTRTSHTSRCNCFILYRNYKKCFMTIEKILQQLGDIETATRGGAVNVLVPCKLPNEGVGDDGITRRETLQYLGLYEVAVQMKGVKWQ